MNIEDQLSLIEDFKVLLRRAMIYAKHSHDFIFDDSVDNSTALFYLNVAASKICCCRITLLLSNQRIRKYRSKRNFSTF